MMRKIQAVHENQEKIRWLTIFRFPLAMWVVLHHFLDSNFESTINLQGFWKVLADTGNLAVTSFFILSGFVIALSFSVRDYKKVSKFYLNRWAALFPLFILMQMSSAFSQPLESRYLLVNILGLQPFLTGGYWFNLNGPAWSVSVEFFMYMIFPVIFRVTSKITKPVKALVVLLLIEFSLTLLIGNFTTVNTAFYILYHFPIFQLFHFISGIFAFKIYVDWKSSKRFTQNGVNLIAGPIFAVAVYGSFYTNIQYLKYGALIVIPTLFYVIGSAVASKNSTTSNDSLLYKAGEATFVIYITHWLWVGTLRKILVSEKNLNLMMLYYFILLIPIIVIAHLFNKKYVKSLAIIISNPKAISNYRTRFVGTISIFLCMSLVLGFANRSFPRYWNTQNSPKNGAVSIEVVSASLSNQETKVNVEIQIINRSENAQSIESCRIFITPRDLKLYGDMPPPIHVPLNLLLKPNEGGRTSMQTEWLPRYSKNFQTTVTCA